MRLAFCLDRFSLPVVGRIDGFKVGRGVMIVMVASECDLAYHIIDLLTLRNTPNVTSTGLKFVNGTLSLLKGPEFLPDMDIINNTERDTLLRVGNVSQRLAWGLSDHGLWHDSRTVTRDDNV